jgi:hypothetical protein
MGMGEGKLLRHLPCASYDHVSQDALGIWYSLGGHGVVDGGKERA